MSIRILPNNLINQIAAGEVVERPASVLKELVENAIDAGATSIEVTLVDGGKSLMSIVDNGKGMSKDELSLAVERHATSKLPDDNLFNINFLGFRGEALPSIASVARMSITSRASGSDDAWRIEVCGGEKSDIAPAALSKGTRIEVRDLFYATPARLKFLKTAAAETAQCVDIMNRIALANPHISFYLNDDNKRKIALNAQQGELFDARLKRLSDVMGKEFGENSFLINAERESLKITGYTSLPTLNKANSLSQYLFVNNRPVRDKLLLGADQILCGKNITRHALNDKLRRIKFGDAYSSSPINGDKVICLKNEWQTICNNEEPLINGMIGTISNISLKESKLYNPKSKQIINKILIRMFLYFCM